jgi:hypothetical protein
MSFRFRRERSKIPDFSQINLRFLKFRGFWGFKELGTSGRIDGRNHLHLRRQKDSFQGKNLYHILPYHELKSTIIYQ